MPGQNQNRLIFGICNLPKQTRILKTALSGCQIAVIFSRGTFRNSNNSKMCTYRLHLRYISHDTFHSASHSPLSERRCSPCDFHLSWPTKFNQSTPEHEPQSCLVYNKLAAAPSDCKNNLFWCHDLVASQWPDVKKSNRDVKYFTVQH